MLSMLHVEAAPPVQDGLPTVGVSTPLTSAVVRLAQSAKQCADKVTSAKLEPIILDWYEVVGLDEQQARQALVSCTSDVYPSIELHTFDDPPPPLSAFTVPSDPQLSQQWHIDKISAPRAWDTSRGDGVIIAVIDTGVYCAHADMRGKCVNAGKDFINNDDDAFDDNGHGTHVAGTIAALTNNGLGVAGVGYNAQVLPVKVLSSQGSGSMPDIVRGMDWASQQPGVKAISMSLGAQTGASVPLMADAVRLVRSRGVAVIAAAGNNNTDVFTTPAAEAGVIGVAATDGSDLKANFSNYGINADVAAPGVQIYATLLGGAYGFMSGTSMAAPVASGVYALAVAACPACSMAQLEARLLDGDIVGNQRIGKRVNAARAVANASGPTLTPQPTSAPGATATPSSDFDVEVVVEINRRRAENSLPALALDPRLVDIARQHNNVMASQNCFAHDCPGELGVWDRLASAGYPNYQGSEVIARGYQTPRDVVNGWLGSAPHRAIILSSAMTHIGCDALDANMGPFWTCDEGRRSGTQPQPTSAPTATLTPIPQPTMPTPSPLPTSTPAFLDPAYTMVIHFPYRYFRWQEIHDLYVQFCRNMVGHGVWCTWEKDTMPKVEP